MNSGTFATGDRVVIPLRVPPRTKIAFPLITVASLLISAAMMVFALSFETGLIGVLMYGSLGYVWSVVLSSRRAAHGQPLDIVATRDGLSSPLWSVPWSRVDRINKVIDTDGRPVELWIQATRPSDVRWTTRMLCLDASISRRFGYPTIRIMQKLVDQPLSEIFDDLERLARRPLT